MTTDDLSWSVTNSVQCSNTSWQKARQQRAKLASEMLGVSLPLSVMYCNRGFYLGSYDESGPVSRESVESWNTAEEAEAALRGVEGVDWTQSTDI